MAFNMKDFMLGLTGGINAKGEGAAGILSGIAGGYNAVKDNRAYQKGISQINKGDWQGGIDTIAERNPEVAMGIMQYKQKADDAFALEQMKEQARNTITPYQQEMLNLSRQRLAQSQSGESNPFASKNEFINLMGIRNNPKVWDSLPDDQKALVDARLSYMSNAPENIYEKAYQGQRGKDIAKQEMTNIQNAQQSQQQQQNLSNAINLVASLPDNLFMPYSEISSLAGTYTDGMVGMSPEENEQYGYLEKTIGTIENDLIAKARSKGQSGINTIAEIRQAAKGLQLGRGKQRLKGALQAMYNIEKKLDAMPTVMTPINNTQDNSNISDADILQGLM